MIDYTVVIGVDSYTLNFLRLVWPTWRKHKPSLLKKKFIFFYDGIPATSIQDIVGIDAGYVAWPPHQVTYLRDGLSKWENSQRAKMLAGFLYVPAAHVDTPYWLKLDLDVVASGRDAWVDPLWFSGNPSIIAPGWSYTKPPDQITRLDDWAARAQIGVFSGTQPMNLKPAPTAENPNPDKVCHPRICSWCAFFSTEFTKYFAAVAEQTCGKGQMPVDSQDGYMWYCAERGGFTIRKVPMKKYGWVLRHGINRVQETALGVLS